MATLGMFLTKKPAEFLMALSNSRKSALAIGKEIYGCNNSIYDTLDNFESLGLVIVNKDGRNLKVTLTPKGKQKLFHVAGLLDCKL